MDYQQRGPDETTGLEYEDHDILAYPAAAPPDKSVLPSYAAQDKTRLEYPAMEDKDLLGTLQDKMDYHQTAMEDKAVLEYESTIKTVR